MKILLIATMTLFSAQALGADFCDAVPAFGLAQLSEKKAEFVDRRVRTEGVLATDVKEWGYIQATADGPALFGLASDEEAQRYRTSHGLSASLRETTIQNFYDARRRAGKSALPSALPEIVNFRQRLDLCGRIIVRDGNFSFVIDDFRERDSYFTRKPLKASSTK